MLPKTALSRLGVDTLVSIAVTVALFFRRNIFRRFSHGRKRLALLLISTGEKKEDIVESKLLAGCRWVGLSYGRLSTDDLTDGAASTCVSRTTVLIPLWLSPERNKKKYIDAVYMMIYYTVRHGSTLSYIHRERVAKREPQIFTLDREQQKKYNKNYVTPDSTSPTAIAQEQVLLHRTHTNG